MKCSKKVSSAFRVDGSAGALELEIEQGHQPSILFTKDLHAEMGNGTTIVAAYIATPIPLAKLNSSRTKALFRYLDADGNAAKIVGTIEVDAASTWSGVQQGIGAFKIHADVANAATPIGPDRNFTFELYYYAEDSDTELIVYLDMDLKSE